MTAVLRFSVSLHIHPPSIYPLSQTQQTYKVQSRLQIAIAIAVTLFQFESFSFTFTHFLNIQQTFAFIFYMPPSAISLYSMKANDEYTICLFCVSIFGCVFVFVLFICIVYYLFSFFFCSDLCLLCIWDWRI